MSVHSQITYKEIAFESRVNHSRLFAFCYWRDFYLDPMTFIFNLDLDNTKMYRYG